MRNKKNYLLVMLVMLAIILSAVGCSSGDPSDPSPSPSPTPTPTPSPTPEPEPMGYALPLTFEARTAGVNVRFNLQGEATGNAAPNVDYSIDGGKTWVALTNDGITLAKVGDRVFFRGMNSSYKISNASRSYQFTVSESCYVYGNIMSLIDKNNYKTLTSGLGDYAFYMMFRKQEKIDTYKDENYQILLPATSLAKYCYAQMFEECTGIKKAPKLPATSLSLAYSCYKSMFGSCTGLTTAPELPATSLVESCYAFMFQFCTELTTAPELPAKKLEIYCYENMFNGCTRLNNVTSKATDISADGCLSGWLTDAGTADGCERKLYVDSGMTGDEKWQLSTSGSEDKRWKIAAIP